MDDKWKNYFWSWKYKSWYFLPADCWLWMWEVSAIVLLLVTFQNSAVLKTSWACIVYCIYYPFPVLGPSQPLNEYSLPSPPSGWSRWGTMLTLHLDLAPRLRWWKVNSPPCVYLHSVDRNNFTRPLPPFAVGGGGSVVADERNHIDYLR